MTSGEKVNTTQETTRNNFQTLRSVVRDTVKYLILNIEFAKLENMNLFLWRRYVKYKVAFIYNTSSSQQAKAINQ